MSRRTTLCTPLFTAMLALALACGGGGKNDNGTDDTGMDLPDVTPDDGQPDGGKDVVAPDDGIVTRDDTTVDPGKDDATPPADDGATTDNAVDAPGDTGEETITAPICPCDETLVGTEVCWRDAGTKVRTEYKSEVCAKCALCANDEQTCKGCGGTKADCTDLPQPNYITWKGLCTAPCGCVKQDECDRIAFPDCGKVCAVKGGTPTEYADLCAMKDAFDCDDSYDENILNFGACPAPACEPCLGLAVNAVCGSDGVTYRNQCELANCPSKAGVTRTCLGACVGKDFCAACPTECAPACGDDGVTYGSACAATKCGTKDKLVAYTGACCPECDEDPMIEVCATNGKVYRNMCQALCQGATPCGEAGPQACGLDGQTYANTCWATCQGGGQLHSGACTRLCEQCTAAYTPVCATGPDSALHTYESDCHKTCQGGTGTSVAGQCSNCTAQCGTIASPSIPDGPVCGADGITYPSSCFPQKCLGITYTAGACP
jgi:hypothetical protein